MLLASPDHGLIVARTTPQPVGDDQLAQYLTSIKPAGATGVTPAEPVSIDGASGVVITYHGRAQRRRRAGDRGDGREQGRQHLRDRADHGAGRLRPDASALQEVLNSWTWA